MTSPLLGQMMDVPLLASSLISYASRHFGATEIVSRRIEGDIHRYTWRDCEKRAKQLAQALIGLNVQPGERVGTLAWNGYRHLECYYGVTGMGAVCHTINPRLFPDQIAFIINHADDEYVAFDMTFTALVDIIAPQCPNVKGWIALGDEACISTHLADMATPVTSYETLLAKHDGDYEWPMLDERSASFLCYTSGTTGNPEGRAVHASLDGPACLRRSASRRHGLFLPRFDLARRADVPRQCMGHSARGAAGWREARAARQLSRWKIALRTDGSRRRDVLGRRADRPGWVC